MTTGSRPPRSCDDRYCRWSRPDATRGHAFQAQADRRWSADPWRDEARSRDSPAWRGTRVGQCPRRPWRRSTVPRLRTLRQPARSRDTRVDRERTVEAESRLPDGSSARGILDRWPMPGRLPLFGAPLPKAQWGPVLTAFESNRRQELDFDASGPGNEWPLRSMTSIHYPYEVTESVCTRTGTSPSSRSAWAARRDAHFRSCDLTRWCWSAALHPGTTSMPWKTECQPRPSNAQPACDFGPC